MIALLAVAVVWLGLPLVLVGWWFLDRHREQAWEADRPADYYDMPREHEETTAEWLAVLAATDEPVFAEVWADSLRRDLEEWSA